MRSPRDSWETIDGSRPEPVPLDVAVGKAAPLGAFALLAGGDAFEDTSGRPPPNGASLAQRYWREKVVLVHEGAPPPICDRVQREVCQMLAGNQALVTRMQAAPSLEIAVLPPGAPFSRFGFPRQVVPGAIGLFWHQRGWPTGKIALREEAMETTPALVFHEMAHAVHALAFTKEERVNIDRALGRTWRNGADRDEVFAIYSEREFLPEFRTHDFRAPGVYGVARQRWNEEHLFTRFVRHLYFPYKPLAGPKLR